MTIRVSKTKKKQALATLMRSTPASEDLKQLFYELCSPPAANEHAHDRTVAIVGATFVEAALAKAIKTHFKEDRSDPGFAYVFDNDEAPLRDFAAKNRLALALGVISRQEFDNLELVRRI